MGTIELLLIALGLSADAFAVSVCHGLKLKQVKVSQALNAALHFGIFQGIMPLIGYFIGEQFSQYLIPYNQFIAFLLLAFLGIKVILESFKPKAEVCIECEEQSMHLFMSAVATSIDALAIGVSFAFLQNINILFAASSITIVTLIVTFIGVYIGAKIGHKYEKKAELIGGIILVLLAFKILLGL